MFLCMHGEHNTYVLQVYGFDSFTEMSFRHGLAIICPYSAPKRIKMRMYCMIVTDTVSTCDGGEEEGGGRHNYIMYGPKAF